MIFKGQLPTLKAGYKAPKLVNHLGENGHWDFPEQLGQGAGFIYVIYDNYMNRAYLGKKQFKGMGKLNRGVESNWKKYTSSSKVLNLLIKERDRSEFEFIAIEQYNAKGALSYAETWSLCLVEAPTTDNWYNTLIEKVSWPVREQVTARHKERLAHIIERVHKENRK